MTPKYHKLIYFNSHTDSISKYGDSKIKYWLAALKFILRIFGYYWENVYFTFDDFYLHEKTQIERLINLGLNRNIYIFYCPNLLSKNDISKQIRSSSSQPVQSGNLADLQYLKKNFTWIQIGLHGYEHEDYEILLEKNEIEKLISKQKEFHRYALNEDCKCFSFPYGRASSVANNIISIQFDEVFFSDNRKKITTIRKSESDNSINRRHLEICGSLVKLIAIIFLERFKDDNIWNSRTNG
jgi:hypothetical protein